MTDTLTVFNLSILCSLAFCAGLIDSVVGGGGLIQIPALFNAFPATSEAALLGTNKLAAVSGTSVAARSFFGRVHIPWNLVLPAAIAAFVMAFLGAATVSLIPRGVLRPLVLLLIVVMAFYVFWKKDFGRLQRPLAVGTRERVLAVLIGGAIGFYDGLFGPGTGSFLVFALVGLLGYNFLEASAHEASRSEKQPKLLEAARQGLTASVENLESSHPKLFATVNQAAVVLANMGL